MGHIEGGKSATVLVVEDEVIIATDIQRTLIRLGYNVPRTVATGGAAISVANELQPDLVLMDIKLRGDMDGIQAAEAIRTQMDIPVVFLTSYSDEGTLERAKVAEPHGYLIKPFNDRQVRAVVEVALYKHGIETKLAERERWFSTTLHSIGDGVIATNSSEEVTFVNGEAERLTGWHSADAKGLQLRDIYHVTDASGQTVVSPLGHALISRAVSPVSQGTMLTTKSGSTYQIEHRGAPIIDDREKVLGGVLVFRDVTERCALERQVATADRLSTVGTMAAGMVHEISNPLTYVMGNTDFAVLGVERAQKRLHGYEPELARSPEVAASIEDLARANEALVDASEGANRLRLIVENFSRFTRGQVAAAQRLDLWATLEVAVKMVSTLLSREVAVLRDRQRMPEVDGNEGQLVQVFTNLLVNALHALVARAPSSPFIRLKGFADRGGNAVIEIEDNGGGVPDSVKDRIFEPFFTTKAQSGTGLGLYICQKIVANHHGNIALITTNSVGTTFRITLPYAAEVTTSTPPPSLSPTQSGRPRRILVIDDEPSIGRTVRRLLGAEFDVVIELDGKAALARLKTGEVFDRILCDLHMPGADGVAFYEALAHADPVAAQRLVFITGGACSPREAAFLNGFAGRVLDKPFLPDALREAALN